jgi:RNA polymerase sigma-70 factor (ECF subfamily)
MKTDFDSTYLPTSKDRYCLFFKENYQAACLIANRYVKNLEQSEDLVQDVFIVMWERWESVQKCNNPRNYLFTAVKNHALNHILRGKKETVEFSDIFREIPEDDATDFYDNEVMAVKILHAIDVLPPQCKKIFNLAYQKNLSYQEISDELNISKNTIKTQIGIAYKSLRIKLNELVIIGFCIFQKKN